MRTAVIAALLLVVAACAAMATEVVLRNDRKLVGEVISQSRDGIVLRIPFGNDDTGGSVERPILWGNITTMDGLPVAEWLELSGEDSADEAGSDEEAEREIPRSVAELIGWFREWIGASGGMRVYQRIGSLFLLILIPGLALLWVGRTLRIRGMDGARAFGASILSFGGAALALQFCPWWAAGLPLGALGTILLLTWYVVRPPLGRGIALFVIQAVSIVGVILGVFFVSRFLP